MRISKLLTWLRRAEEGVPMANSSKFDHPVERVVERANFEFKEGELELGEATKASPHTTYDEMIDTIRDKFGFSKSSRTGNYASKISSERGKEGLSSKIK